MSTHHSCISPVSVVSLQQLMSGWSVHMAWDELYFSSFFTTLFVTNNNNSQVSGITASSVKSTKLHNLFFAPPCQSYSDLFFAPPCQHYSDYSNHESCWQMLLIRIPSILHARPDNIVNQYSIPDHETLSIFHSRWWNTANIPCQAMDKWPAQIPRICCGTGSSWRGPLCRKALGTW